MTIDYKKPSVTFALIGFKQEAFIAEAVEGALAQTYSPLEIIISDDCSPDDTFMLMRQAALDYRGPHKIIFNHNETNVGIARHINKVVEMASGDIIIIAAGDDISLPNRVEELVKIWVEGQGAVLALQSAFTVIDKRGVSVANVNAKIPNNGVVELGSKRDLSHYLETLQIPVCGATFAYDRRIFDIFGPLPYDVIHEDNLVCLRAILLGSIKLLDVPLVKRRAHDSNIALRNSGAARTWIELEREEEQSLAVLKWRMDLYDAFAQDLRVAKTKQLLSEDEAESALEICARQREHYRMLYSYSGASFFTKLKIISTLRQSGMGFGRIKSLLTRLAPRPILLFGKQIYAPFRRPQPHPVVKYKRSWRVSWLRTSDDDVGLQIN